ncbi:MAG: hypothetical protein ACJAWY_002201 [Sphingomonas echinoides]|jgi:hypothetical protein
MPHPAVEQAKEMDREWFEDHPGRTIRIRDALPYEFNQPLPQARPGYTWRVIVKEVKIGMRARSPLAARTELRNEDAKETDLERILREVSPDALKYIRHQ